MKKRSTFGGSLLALLLLTSISGDHGVPQALGRYYDCDNPFEPPPDPDELVWLPHRTFCVGDQEMDSNPGFWLIDDYPQEDLADCPERGTARRLQETSGGCWWEVASAIDAEINYQETFTCNGNIYPSYYIRGHIEQYNQEFFLICPGYPTQTHYLNIAAKFYVQEPVGPREIIPEKNLGEPRCGISAGNPVNIATGNKFHRASDATFPGGREITRFYNSANVSAGAFGAGWRSRYSRKIAYTASMTPREASISLIRDDGSVNYWRVRDAEVVAPPDARGRLEIAREGGVIAGFRYHEHGRTETYGADGRLLLLERSSGERLAFDYDGPRLVAVTDASGRALQFEHDEDGRITQIGSEDGSFWNYLYDAAGNLASVQGPDGEIRSYHYEDVVHPHALTGVTDESGKRIRSWAYDAEGRAVLSVFGAPDSEVERYVITYQEDGSATTVGPTQQPVNHSFEISHGVARFGTVSDVCTACDRDVASITYDLHGNPDIVTDHRGNASDYDYSPDNLLLNLTHAVGAGESYSIQNEWDQALRQPVRTVSPDRETTYTYNARGQVLSRTETDLLDGENRSWAYVYFEDPGQPERLGKKQSVDGPRTDVQDVTLFEYYPADDPEGRFRAGDLKAVINPLGHRTEYLEYDADGRVTRLLAADGVETTFSYDPRGRKRTTTTAGRTVTFDRDPSGNVIRITQPDGAYLDYGYDELNRLTAIADAFGNRIEYTLDASGNRITESTLDANGLLTRELQRVYDSLDRLERLVTGTGAETSFTYDANGNRLSTTNAMGYSTAYQYDALDRMIASVDPISGETGREYDHEGRTLAISDPLGHLTHFEFDGLGNRLRKDSPDSGVTLWEHDAAGNPTAAIDARGVRTEYVYDALGRLLSIATPDESLNVQFSYDAGPHGIGRLTGMVDAWGQVQYEYDAGGKLMTEVRVIDGETYITAHEYDPAGRRVRTVYPSGMIIDFERDAAGRVTTISRAGDESAEVLVSGIEYLPFGPVAQFQFGNGLSYAAQHRLDGRVQQLQSGGLHWELAHDLAGNLVSISDQGGGLGDQVFAYDPLDRIVSAQGSYGLQIFEYDGNGNRSRLQHDALDEVYGYELDSNRLVSRSDRTYEHDLRGNRRQVLNDGGQDYLYRYDDHNRFRELVLQSPGGDEILAEYRYDGLGRRIAKSTQQDAVHFARDASGRLLGEYEPGANGRAREYVYLEGQPIAVIDRTTVWNTPLGEELILDNGDPGTSFTGSWRQRSSSQAYGGDYLYASKASDRSYRWAAVPPGDTYRVYGRWVAKKSHSAAVHYTIRHGTGETETLTRSHKAGGGQWQLLGTYTRGDGQDYVEVRSDTGRFVADAVRWEEVRPPVPTVIESTHFVHFDHLGTPRLVTDSDQSAVWSWSSAPDGTSGPDEDPDGDGEPFVLNLRYPGQYYDSESGLHYNLFRDYDPATGRYLQSDPAGLVDGTNTYRYARNSPMNLIDPLGLWVKRCSRKLGGPTEPPVRPDSHNPFRHDFLVVSGVIYSFQSGGDNWWDILLSQGRIDSNEFENELCVSVCDDDRFDAFVHDAVNEVGAPSYCVVAFPGTPEYKAGARNCQTWANEVIDVARRNYLEANRNGCPNCFAD